MKKISLLILGLVLLALPAHALPRRQHLLHGKIVGVDAAARTFTVETTTPGRFVALAWDDTTKLRDGKAPAPASALTPGRTVKLHYRADVGVNVARDITLQPATPPPSATAPTR
jgi:hypothetical protein